MKKGKHSTFNIQLPTPKVSEAAVWEFNEGAGANRKYDLEGRLLEFASAVIDLSENLPATRAGNHVAGQVLRSGTSPYPNHGEAEAAESRDDFIHKLKICLKELRETPALGAAHQAESLGEERNDVTVCAGGVRRADPHIPFKHPDGEAQCRGTSAQPIKSYPLSARQRRLTPSMLSVECSH